MSGETCRMLVLPSRNPVRNQLYEAQIKHHHINVGVRQLRRRLKQETKNAQRFKQAYVKKEISKVNKNKRVDYGWEHKDKTIENWWQYLYFTDEAHIDPSSLRQGYILREEGHRLDDENIQERPAKIGVKLHVAGWVNWHEKCPELTFYYDEEEYTMRPKRPRKPRRRKYESKDQWNERLAVWQAQLPHEREVKPKGNAMTQKYYVERLLPVYVSAIQAARLRDPQPWILQEDNDQSHGHKPPKGQTSSLAGKYKDANWVPTLVHPPQSPDLNPIEACWNILKTRIRYRVWDDIEELKRALQEEWNKITMEEVRARIAEMPARCERLTKNGGGPIKSDLW